MFSIGDMLRPVPDKSKAPHVPSKAIIVIYLGVPSLEYHHGSALEYWMDTVGPEDFLKEVIGKEQEEQDGVYVWSGTIGSNQDYYGEWDEWLEGELRPITKEEWQDHITENIPWDQDELEALQKWYQEQDQKYQDEQLAACRCDATHCEIHEATNRKRKELLARLGRDLYDPEDEFKALKRLANTAQYLRKRYSYARDGDVTISGLMEFWGAVDAYNDKYDQHK